MNRSENGVARFVPWDSKLLMGLFIPIQNGAWSPSLAPRGTDWRFDYNLKCVQEAEKLGFDFVFGLGQWHRKGGYGGVTNYHEQHLDPLIVSAGLAAATERIGLISTTHVLYGWHPTLLAKLSATIDHMSGGRFGINVVTGYKPFEFEMFGQDPIPKDARYEMANEFVADMEELWKADANIDFSGDSWSAKGAFITPKPERGRPMIVSAGSSPAGVDFAMRHADMLFITSPAGYLADIDQTIEALSDYINQIHAQTPPDRERLRLIINPHIICRDTEKEAWDYYRSIADNPDIAAVEALDQTLMGGDHSSWKAGNSTIDNARDAMIERHAVGGNIIIVGSPEQVADKLAGLSACGMDGVQINFFDYLPDLKFFGDRVLPLLKERGLR